MKNSKTRYQAYLDFVEKYKNNLGYKGDYSKGEIEVVSDVNLFPQCESGSVAIMVKTGTSGVDAEKRSKIGIFDENRWGVSIHEPLRLPNGSYTVFNRWISWGTLDSGFAGCVVAPITSSGKYVFLKNFRNATKVWCLEFPRGNKDIGNSLLKTVKTELSEEIGAEIIGEPKEVGSVCPDSGVLSSVVPIYKVEINFTGKPEYEVTEAIRGVVFLDKKELKEVIVNQKYVDRDGKEYEFKDGFTLSALTILSVS
ncbi:MAG: hypothetical protein QY322_01890 [bacterium]|nr:MAG: hypothetical protein QY322_01890 [bacterium]